MEVVGAFACSHAGLILTRRHSAPAEQRDAIFGAFAEIRDKVAALRPDALVMIGTDHMRAFPLSGIPAYAIGVGPVAEGMGDAGMDPCSCPINQACGRTILEGCLSREVDLAFSEQVSIDHAFVMPLTLINPRWDVPIVPIWQNCNVPPQPTFRRAQSVGRAIGESLREDGDGRVVVIGTGGLSHWVGDDERQAFMHRPAGDRLAQVHEHPVTLTDTAPINVEFDHAFLEATSSGQLGSFVRDWTPQRLEREAGNGAQELRTWMMTASVVENVPARVLAYEPVAEWLTGIALVEFSVG